MLNGIRFTGRLCLLVICAMFLEGMLTLGGAFQFEEYTAIGCVFQALVFCCLVWATAEWTDAEKHEQQ
jgi:hypothetical protein